MAFFEFVDTGSVFNQLRGQLRAEAISSAHLLPDEWASADFLARKVLCRGIGNHVMGLLVDGVIKTEVVLTYRQFTERFTVEINNGPLLVEQHQAVRDQLYDFMEQLFSKFSWEKPCCVIQAEGWSSVGTLAVVKAFQSVETPRAEGVPQ